MKLATRQGWLAWMHTEPPAVMARQYSTTRSACVATRCLHARAHERALADARLHAFGSRRSVEGAERRGGGVPVCAQQRTVNVPEIVLAAHARLRRVVQLDRDEAVAVPVC